MKYFLNQVLLGKGWIISEGIFDLVPSSKKGNQITALSSFFKNKLKEWKAVIWFRFCFDENIFSENPTFTIYFLIKYNGIEIGMILQKWLKNIFRVNFFFRAINCRKLHSETSNSKAIVDIVSVLISKKLEPIFLSV